MLGNGETKGLMTICLEDIFKKKEMLEDRADVKIKVQYVEIYNE
jgi:hypothetical protein